MTSTQRKNPFEGMDIDRIYQGLVSGEFGPHWPSERMQRAYTGSSGPGLARRGRRFLGILAEDGAFSHGWKGLDYGCGWGRFASLLLERGRPSQLDLCDAWEQTLEIIRELNFENEIFAIPELLDEGSIPRGKYNFILCFSIFTHLSKQSFHQNIPHLLNALNEDGSLYFTVRHEEFFDHKYPDRAAELKAQLAKDDFVFLDTAGDRSGEGLFGDTIVTKKFLSQFGELKYLGLPHPLQHIYSLKPS